MSCTSLYQAPGGPAPKRGLVLVRFFDGPWARMLHLVQMAECDCLPEIPVERMPHQPAGLYVYAYNTRHRWTVEYSWQPAA